MEISRLKRICIKIKTFKTARHRCQQQIIGFFVKLIRHDRKLNYFAEQIKFCQKAWKEEKGVKIWQNLSCRTHQILLESLEIRRKNVKYFRNFLAELIFNLQAEGLCKNFFCQLLEDLS